VKRTPTTADVEGVGDGVRDRVDEDVSDDARVLVCVTDDVTEMVFVGDGVGDGELPKDGLAVELRDALDVTDTLAGGDRESVQSLHVDATDLEEEND
jgi:adenosyl cobinamide kinase/adenosyl cobinamide phosphate guanylyltransferase